MSFFDNAKEILIGDKEVALLKIGDKTVYEKSQPVPPTPSENVHLTFVDGESEPIYPYEIRIKSQGTSSIDIDETLSVDLDGSVSFYCDLELVDAMLIYAPSTLIAYNFKLTRDGQYAWQVIDDYNISIAYGDDPSDIEATITISS